MVTVVVASHEPAQLDVERARDFLARCKSSDEAKGLRDKAAAVAIYLRTRGASLEAQNDALEIKLRAERRIGELTREIPKAAPQEKAGRGKVGPTPGLTSKTSSLRDLNVPKQRAAEFETLASIPEKEFEEHVTKTRAASTRLSTSAAVALSRAKTKASVVARIASEPQPLPAGPFRVLVADPPWQYEKRAEDATHRGANPYPTMTIEQICAIPVRPIAHEDSVLWLWTTNAFMREAFQVIDAWGFHEKTILTWAKDRMGVGDWLRGQSEHCILAARGKPVVTLTNQTTILRASPREHSRKPDEFYSIVEALCHGSKVELFAREARSGWRTWGAEADKFTGAA